MKTSLLLSTIAIGVVVAGGAVATIVAMNAAPKRTADAPTVAVTEEGAAPGPDTKSVPSPTPDTKREPDRVKVTLELYGDATPPSAVELTLVPDADEARATTVRFAGGAREAEAPLARCYGVKSLRLDAWTSDQPMRHLVPDVHGRVVARVRLPSVTTVTVVDAENGKPIEGAHATPMPIAVAFDSSLVPLSAVVSPPAEVLAGASTTGTPDGRITLPPTTQRAECWVGAPGHAWAMIATGCGTPQAKVGLVPQLPPGRIRVVVKPAASVEDAIVSAESAERPPKQAIELKPSGEPGAFLAEDVAPGTWKVRVSPRAGTAPGERSTTTWASTSVEVVAGGDAEASVFVGKRTGRPRQDLTGSLTVPAEWKEKPTKLTLRGVSDGNKDVERDIEIDTKLPGPSWWWKAEKVVEGEYEIVVHPYRYETKTVVERQWRRPTKPKPVEIEVPAPVTFRVRALDAESDEPLPYLVPTVWYFRPDPPKPASMDADASSEDDASKPKPPKPVVVSAAWFHLLEPTWDTNANAFVAQGIPGLVRVQAGAPGYVAGVEKVTNDARTVFSTHTFHLQRAGRVALRVVRDGKPAANLHGWFEFPLVERSATALEFTRETGSDVHGSVDFDESGGVGAGTHEALLHVDGVEKPVRQKFEVRVGEETVVDFETR